MSRGWTHRSCERCYVERQIAESDPEDQWVTIKAPVLLKQEHMIENNNAVGTCCLCGWPTVIGLYIRVDPSTVSCTHGKDEC